MKVAQLLSERRANWDELERFCAQLEKRVTRVPPAELIRFAALYRGACADLALADAYQLPPGNVQYLHHLVGRAHNQLYRSQSFRLGRWGHELLERVPRKLFNDPALRLAFVVFWSLFFASGLLAYRSPRYAEATIGPEMMGQMEDNFAEPLGNRDAGSRARMVGFYVINNAGIGLQCFALGLLGGAGGLVVLVSNALILGASFGHMGTVPARDNFFEFVTAHGPFELTAIILSAAAGMRLGFALVDTRGLSRRAAVRETGAEVLPVMGAAVVLFVLAALIEGFLSPSPAPYWVKALTAVISSGLMVFYFVMLGQLDEDEHATG